MTLYGSIQNLLEVIFIFVGTEIMIMMTLSGIMSYSMRLVCMYFVSFYLSMTNVSFLHSCFILWCTVPCLNVSTRVELYKMTMRLPVERGFPFELIY